MGTNNFSIDLKLWNRFKQIEPTFEKGVYYNNVLTWGLKGFSSTEIEDLSHYLFILSRLTTEEDLENSGLNIIRTYYYLFHTSYFDKEIFKGDEFISLGYKRPFGNSYIQGDIATCIDPQYMEYLKEQGMDITYDDTEGGDHYLIESPYREGDEIKYLQIDSSKLNIDFIIKEYNKVLMEIIQKVDFKYHQFESTDLHTFKNLSNNGKLSDIQVNNSVNLEFTEVIFPSRAYLREEFIDNVLK